VKAMGDQVHRYTKNVLHMTILAGAAVGMIDRHGAAALNISLSDVTYWTNMLGSATDPKDIPLVRQNLSWLVDVFDLHRRPEVVDRINAPIRFMGFAAYAELALDLAQFTLGVGWSESDRVEYVIPIFKNLYNTFSNAGASHHTFTIGRRSLRRIFISNGKSEAETAGVLVNDMVHEILDAVDPSFQDDEPEQITKMSDWFTSGLEYLAIQRAGGIDRLRAGSDDGISHSTSYHAEAFQRQLEKPNAATTAERVTQIDQTVRDTVESMRKDDTWTEYVTGEGARIHFYLRGAAFGAEAFKRARDYALSIGQGHNETYIYTLAGRYIVAGALGGATQSFAQVVARTDAMFLELALQTYEPLPQSSSPGQYSVANNTIIHRWVNSTVEPAWSAHPHRPRLAETAA
jgi:hypothetical protein